MQDRHYWRRVEELFNTVLETPPGERVARSDALCGGDLALRAQVLRLLDSDERVVVGFLEPPVSFDDSTFSIPSDMSAAQRWIGRQIGRFTLVRCLGVGGMGAVYEATQSHPRRTVAVKLMLGAMPSPQRVRRFVTEAEILAGLHHPHIAQVYEVGTGDDPETAPYMAMELIPDAAPITEFVRRRHLDRRPRLELFLQVCDAVQYVHQRGVIHRDLKPANILVDAAGRPKVIDFGVARLVEADPAAATRLTDPRQLVGTLPYMAPEQLRGGAGQVDTSCDVYALGVILFEMLSGRFPYDVPSGTLADAIRVMENAEPVRLGGLDRSLRGDMETIVGKALARDKERRYASAGQLADDIRRHLRDEPILARPPSARYQVLKFARRNRALVAGASVALIVAFIGTATTTWKAIEATRERIRAEQAAQKSERIVWFLQTVLSSADPRHADADVSIRDALDQAAARADAEMADEPEVLADVHALVGSIYTRMKRNAAGERHLRKALELRRELYGASDCRVAETMTDLAWALPDDRTEECEALFIGAMEILRDHYGDDHPSVAVARAQVAAARSWNGGDAEAVAICREVLPVLRRELGEQHADVGFALATLAHALARLDDTDEAEAAYREAIAVKRAGASPPELADTLGNFARFLRTLGRDDEAAPFAAEATEIRAKRLGQTHDG